MRNISNIAIWRLGLQAPNYSSGQWVRSDFWLASKEKKAWKRGIGTWLNFSSVRKTLVVRWCIYKYYKLLTFESGSSEIDDVFSAICFSLTVFHDDFVIVFLFPFNPTAFTWIAGNGFFRLFRTKVPPRACFPLARSIKANQKTGTCHACYMILAMRWL